MLELERFCGVFPTTFSLIFEFASGLFSLSQASFFVAIAEGQSSRCVTSFKQFIKRENEKLNICFLNICIKYMYFIKRL